MHFAIWFSMAHKMSLQLIQAKWKIASVREREREQNNDNKIITLNFWYCSDIFLWNYSLRSFYCNGRYYKINNNVILNGLQLNYMHNGVEKSRSVSPKPDKAKTKLKRGPNSFRVWLSRWLFCHIPAVYLWFVCLALIFFLLCWKLQSDSNQPKWLEPNNEIFTSSIYQLPINHIDLSTSNWLKEEERLVNILNCCLVPFEQIICMFEASKWWYFSWHMEVTETHLMVCYCIFKSHAHE